MTKSYNEECINKRSSGWKPEKIFCHGKDFDKKDFSISL